MRLPICRVYLPIIVILRLGYFIGITLDAYILKGSGLTVLQGELSLCIGLISSFYHTSVFRHRIWIICKRTVVDFHCHSKGFLLDCLRGLCIGCIVSHKFCHGQRPLQIIIGDLRTLAAAVDGHGHFRRLVDRAVKLSAVCLGHGIGLTCLQSFDLYDLSRAGACKFSIAIQCSTFTRHSAFRAVRIEHHPVISDNGDLLLPIHFTDPECKFLCAVLRILMSQALGQIQVFPFIDIGDRSGRS